MIENKTNHSGLIVRLLLRGVTKDAAEVPTTSITDVLHKNLTDPWDHCGQSVVFEGL